MCIELENNTVLTVILAILVFIASAAFWLSVKAIQSSKEEKEKKMRYKVLKPFLTETQNYEKGDIYESYSGDSFTKRLLHHGFIGEGHPSIMSDIIKRLEYLEAEEVIRKDAKGFVPDWNNDSQPKYYGVYDNSIRVFDYGCDYYSNVGVIYFKTKNDIKESFAKHKKEWRIYLNVTEN